MSTGYRTVEDRISPAIDRKDIIRRLKATGREPEMALTSRTVKARDYIDSAHFDEERRKLFRAYPAFICLSSQLARPGDFRTPDIAGVPLLFLRGRDGRLRGFRNSCRHRGAPLSMKTCGSGMKKIVCPYHGWSYSDIGALTAIPLKSAFPDFDMDDHGLIPVRTWEESGLVFAIIDDADISASPPAHLGAIARELDALGFADLRVAQEDRIVTPTNWKLAFEAFGESYHLPSLHRSLASVIIGSGLTYDGHGPHGRITAPLIKLPDLPDDDETAWSNAVAGQHFVILYLIFPNLILTVMDGAATITAISPGRSVDEAITTQYQAFSPALDADIRKEYAKFFDMSLKELTVKEDYPMATGIFNSMRSGSIDHINLGRCEWPLHPYHDFREAVMAGPDRS